VAAQMKPVLAVDPHCRVHFVVLDCALDEDAGGAQGQHTAQQTPAHVQVTSAQEFRTALGMRQVMVRDRIQSLRSRGISLVLCSARCSDLCIFLCLEAGLTLVQAIPREEVSAVCSACGIDPVTQPTLSALTKADTRTAEVVEEIAIGPHRRGLLLGTGLQVGSEHAIKHYE
jgi:hypothetical protein